jgi:hypothetical protein
LVPIWEDSNNYSIGISIGKDGKRRHVQCKGMYVNSNGKEIGVWGGGGGGSSADVKMVPERQG